MALEKLINLNEVKKNSNTKKKNAGYTLLEIMLVILMVSISFTAVYAFYSSVVKQNTESKYEIIASGLAQEGVEIIRNKRDSNALAENNINAGLNNNTCRPYMDSGGGECDTSRSSSIELDNGIYCNRGGSCHGNNTPFDRECGIVFGSDGEIDLLRVECVVSWESFKAEGATREAKAHGVITNWK